MVNAVVVPERYENIEAVVRRFKKTCDRGGIFEDIKRAESFHPKSQARRAKARRAQARQTRRDRKFEDGLRKGFVQW